jgi:hypothetical protein
MSGEFELVWVERVKEALLFLFLPLNGPTSWSLPPVSDEINVNCMLNCTSLGIISRVSQESKVHKTIAGYKSKLLEFILFIALQYTLKHRALGKFTRE